jgi:hypothetical protein
LYQFVWFVPDPGLLQKLSDSVLQARKWRGDNIGIPHHQHQIIARRDMIPHQPHCLTSAAAGPVALNGIADSLAHDKPTA